MTVVQVFYNISFKGSYKVFKKNTCTILLLLDFVVYVYKYLYIFVVHYFGYVM